jgi:hypothetical protein
MKLPAKNPASVTVSAVPIEHAEGISLEGSQDGEVSIRVGAGSYELDVSSG